MEKLNSSLRFTKFISSSTAAASAIRLYGTRKTLRYILSTFNHSDDLSVQKKINDMQNFYKMCTESLRDTSAKWVKVSMNLLLIYTFLSFFLCFSREKYELPRDLHVKLCAYYANVITRADGKQTIEENSFEKFVSLNRFSCARARAL